LRLQVAVGTIVLVHPGECKLIEVDGQFFFAPERIQAPWDMGSAVIIELGFGGRYPQALQAAKQWLQLGVDVRYRHWAV